MSKGFGYEGKAQSITMPQNHATKRHRDKFHIFSTTAQVEKDVTLYPRNVLNMTLTKKFVAKMGSLPSRR
jgi:hypothetical protein